MFVPVLEADHWWCAAFSINREEVLVIDSMETNAAADVHHLTLIKLVSKDPLPFQIGYKLIIFLTQVMISLKSVLCHGPVLR